jgi:hypothetical protein
MGKENKNVLYAQGCELADGMPTYKPYPASACLIGSPGLKVSTSTTLN